ncbi:hypothetical protein PS15m_003102 [Mucor circinelloides]
MELLQQQPYPNYKNSPSFLSKKKLYKMSVQYRDEALIKQLEAEIEENECGASDCLWFFCCGVFGLICIIPKYNKRKFANDRLILELSKPKFVPGVDQKLPL